MFGLTLFWCLVCRAAEQLDELDYEDSTLKVSDMYTRYPIIRILYRLLINEYKCTMDQELLVLREPMTSHALGGLAGSRRTLQWAAGGREWPPSWKYDNLEERCAKCALSALVPLVALQAVSSRQQGLHCWWSACLEHAAGRDGIRTISDDFLSTSENLAFQTVLPSAYYLSTVHLCTNCLTLT